PMVSPAQQPTTQHCLDIAILWSRSFPFVWSRSFPFAGNTLIDRIPARPIAPRIVTRTWSSVMAQTTVGKQGFVEEVEIQGHIIDSLILPKVLDEVLTHGGAYVLHDL